MILKFKSSELSNAISELQDFIVEKDEDMKSFWILQITKYRRKRTLSQNRYWFAICTQIALTMQCSQMDVHRMIALEYFPKIIKLPNGKMKFVPRETKEFDTLEFMQLIEKGRAWAAMELGLNILDPDQWNEEQRIRLLNEYENANKL